MNADQHWIGKSRDQRKTRYNKSRVDEFQMSVYERSKKKSHLDTVWYEIAMLGFCYAELKRRPEAAEPERNLWLRERCCITAIFLSFLAEANIARQGTESQQISVQQTLRCPPSFFKDGTCGEEVCLKIAFSN